MDILFSIFSGIVPLVVVGIFLFQMSVKIVQEYERGVIFRLGRVVAVREPGLRFVIPFIDRMPKIDMRVVTLDVPSQEAITGDNVTIKVNAVVYYRVLDPVAAIVKVENYMRATQQIAQTSLRNVIGQSELDELLSRREEINRKLQKIIDEATEPWGIKVSVVEVKDVELPENMKRAMAKQAEAERERRAKIIHAAGESEAAVKLAEAAAIMGAEPTTIQLRYLQTLVEISAEHNSTIVFPLPIDLITRFIDLTIGSEVKPPS